MASGGADEKLARDVGFDPAVLALVRRHTGKKVERMTVTGPILPGPGLTVELATATQPKRS